MLFMLDEYLLSVRCWIGGLDNSFFCGELVWWGMWVLGGYSVVLWLVICCFEILVRYVCFLGLYGIIWEVG